MKPRQSQTQAVPEVSESSHDVQPEDFHCERDLVLTRRDAAAGGPADALVTGEEDPRAGLEFLVRKEH